MELQFPDLELNPASGTAHGSGGSQAVDASFRSSERTLEAPSADSTPASAPAASAAPRPRLRPTRRSRIRLRRLIPAWVVSVLVHVTVLMTLAAATVSSEGPLRKVLNIDSALALQEPGAEAELLRIYADPAAVPRDQAIGDEDETAPGDPPSSAAGSTVVAATAGDFSNTPRFRGPGRGGGRVSAATGIGGLGGIAFNRSVLASNPAAPALDLGGRGMIAGDPGQGVNEIGEALDQLAREILRHLKLHKLTVVWLFDESTSMKDDQKAVLEKFDRVSTELKLGVEPTPKPGAGAESKKKAVPPLTHVVAGFGEGIDMVLDKPTPDVDVVGQAVRRLKTDPTGVENTMQAIKTVVDHFAGLIRKDRKLLLVLVTDESGDDGAGIEEARQALKSRNVPLYVIGRQSLFGFPYARHRYVDKVTGDTYFPVIRRGPESADVEMYQWDGLYDRWDEQPSGFAPYELARLTKDTGGIYFILPSEEFMRIRQREQAYSLAQLKEFMPEYDHRLSYVERRNRSPLRRTLYEIVAETKGFRCRGDFPVESQALMEAAAPEGGKATERLNTLITIQTRLEQLAKAAGRETERRWRAHYDLMLASTVAFQVKAYEYRALMASVLKSPPVPAKPTPPGYEAYWHVAHSQTPHAPRAETAKKYAEAERLLKKVVADYPKTPWADLAQDVLNRGLSVQLVEWHRSPKYAERAQYVPKF